MHGTVASRAAWKLDNIDCFGVPLMFVSTQVPGWSPLRYIARRMTKHINWKAGKRAAWGHGNLTQRQRKQ